MKENCIHINSTTGAYTVSTQTYAGQPYLVVPVTMMVEGVHSGSHGPVFHSAEELGRFPGSWDGIPVTIQHPQVGDSFVSANSPEILEQYSVGRIFNTHMEGEKLKAEAWISPALITQISPETLALIQGNTIVEVSIGVFTDETNTSGQWNEEQYNAIAHNHRPDHLALLPGEVGACSVADGCGIRANNMKGGEAMDTNEVIQALKGITNNGLSPIQINSIVLHMKSLGHELSPLAINVDEGFRELMDTARTKLDSMDTNTQTFYLVEMYKDYLIYRVYENGAEKLYRTNYSVGADSTIEFIGDTAQVVKNITFDQVIVGMERTKFKTKEEEKPMVNEKCTPCVEKKVNALIANAVTQYAETDREWLEALEEASLDKMVPKEVEPVVNTEKVVEALSEDDKNALAFGKSQLKAHRDAMVAGITANTEEGIWTPETLNALPNDTLEKLSKSVQKEPVQVNTQTNYAVIGGNTVVQTNATTEEPLYPNGVEIK